MVCVGAACFRGGPEEGLVAGFGLGLGLPFWVYFVLCLRAVLFVSSPERF